MRGNTKGHKVLVMGSGIGMPSMGISCMNFIHFLFGITAKHT